MPSLESTLASIPGYGGYLAKGQYNQQREAGELQQAGALVGLHKHLQDQQREQAMRLELSALGSEATQEQLAAIGAKYGSATDLLKSQTSSLDRKAAIEVARASKEATLAQAKAMAEQTHELRMQGAKTAEERAAETARHNRVMEQFLGAGGKPPPGYRPTKEGNLEAIPGGPADLKLQGAFNQDTSALTSMTNDMDRLAAEANRLKSHPGLEKATGMMSAVPFVGGTATIPGTDPANFKAGLETLKSQVAFGVLQNMRNNSKTGGALGQVSDKEGALLAANLAALDRAQSPEEFKAALGRILDYTEGAKDRLRQAYNLKHKDKVEGAPAAAPAPAAAQPIYAVNPTSKQRLMSTDGGATWKPAP